MFAGMETTECGKGADELWWIPAAVELARDQLWGGRFGERRKRGEFNILSTSELKVEV